MELNIYNGKKNDLLIGLVKRWTLSNDSRTITITLEKVGKGFRYTQWGMDNNGDDIEDLSYKSRITKKKYYAIQDINTIIKKYIPNFTLAAK